MGYAVQDTRDRNIWLSPNKQTTYGTALAVGSLTRRTRFDPTQYPQVSKDYFSDINLAGKGTGLYWPTVRTKIAQDVAFQMSGELDDWLAGFLSVFSLMHTTKTGVGPFTWTSIFEATTRTAPVTTMYHEGGGAVKTRFQDLAIESLKLSGSPRGPIMYQVAMRGSGTLTEGSLSPSALPTPIYLMGNDTDIQIGAPGGAVSIKERVKSWEVNIVTGLEQHRGPGGGVVATFAKIGQQLATLKLVIDQIGSDDLRTLFINDTLQEVDIIINSGAAAQLTIQFPNVYLKASQASDKLAQTWQMTADSTDVMQGTGLQPVNMIAINSEANYLVGA